MSRSPLSDAPILPLPAFIGLSFRLALREFRKGIRGFKIFLACLVLGVGAISAVNSISGSLVNGLNAKGQSILGGDISLQLQNRPMKPSERQWLEQRFSLTHHITLRAMAIIGAGTALESVLSEVKAIEGAYPIVGEIVLANGEALDTRTLRPTEVIVEPDLTARLGLEVGDVLTLGTARMTIAGILGNEPDRMAGGFAFGPRILLSKPALERTGLAAPGSLQEHNYLLRMDARTGTSDLQQAVGLIRQQFPDAEWRVRDRRDASPSLRRSIERIAIFLTLVGLTALVVGGVGIANAVTAYLESRRETIGVYKSLGATTRLVYFIYLTQIGLMSVLGVLFGLALGSAAPVLAYGFVADLLPFEMDVTPHLSALLPAAAFGVLSSLVFALQPLHAACQVPATSLFRPRGLTPRGRVSMSVTVFITLLLSVLGLFAITLLVVQRVEVTLYFVVGLLMSYLLLRTASGVLEAAAKAAGRPRNPLLRLALSNLYRPGAPTRTAMLSIGLSVTLLSIITLVDGNMSRQLQGDLPAETPSYFMLDIQSDQKREIERLTRTVDGFETLNSVPMLRGRVTHMNGVTSSQLTPLADVAWVLRGDRGLTYAAELPVGSELVAGTWWPADYDGEMLVSVEDRILYGFGLAIGDEIGFSILGRDMTAKIASARKVNYQNFGLNFVFVFSPAQLSAAPHTHVMTVTLDEADPAPSLALRQDILSRFPNVSVIRVKESVEQIMDLLGDINLGVRVMSLVTVIAGVLVLAGAMASGHRARLYDAVMLKVLGATRAQILAVYFLEYLLLGTGAALIAAGVGTAASWLIVVKLMQIEWVLLPGALAATIIGASFLTIMMGLFGTWRILGSNSAAVLRTG
ncbi:MAG: ABC transporter permease [Parvibaculales bacterium]